MTSLHHVETFIIISALSSHLGNSQPPILAITLQLVLRAPAHHYYARELTLIAVTILTS